MTIDTQLISNLQPSTPDTRDKPFICPEGFPAQQRADLRVNASAVENQGSYGSCVSKSAVAAGELIRKRAGRPIELSSQFVDFNSRELDNRLGLQGTMVRSGLRVAYHEGICDEVLCPYDISQADVRPSAEAYAQGQTQRIKQYELIYSWLTHGRDWSEMYNRVIPAIQHALVEGLPVIIAMSIGSKFRELQGPLDTHQYMQIGPNNPEIGIHAMCLTGFEGFYATAKNSWGVEHGDNGYVALSWQSLLNNLIDAWPIRGFAGAEVRAAPGIVLRELTRNYLAVRVMPPVAVTTSLWIGAALNSQIYFKAPDGRWRINDVPYLTRTFDDEFELVIEDGMDLNTAAGADVYVAYGTDAMTRTAVKVCTIPVFP